MNHRDFLVQRMEKFLRARIAEESHHSSDEDFRPSLTISRECGAGTFRIEQPLVEYLDEIDDSSSSGWACFDQSLVGKIIEDNRISTTVEPYHKEEAKFPIKESLEQILQLHPGEWSLFNYSASTIRKLCKLGNAIIVGRAGNFVTSDLENTFHLRLVGSLERRIETTQNRFSITRGEAARLIAHTDQSREHFVKRYTGSDVDDPNAYHAVINTDHFTNEVLVRIIGDSIVEWAHEKRGIERPLTVVTPISKFDQGR
ncbi:MAG: cytidylate kinase-like family protein [Verrucomicrobiota bacterium]